MKELQRFRVTLLLITVLMTITIIIVVEGVKADALEKKEWRDPITISNGLSLSRGEIIKTHAEKTTFLDSSTIEKYGHSVIGGIHIYLSPNDAELIFYNLLLLLPIVSSNKKAFGIITLMVVLTLQTAYWLKQSSDGSLDVNVPYSHLLTWVIVGYVCINVADNKHRS